MDFEYTALGQDQSQQSGRIEASTEEEAKQKLNQMGLAVVQLEKASKIEINDNKSIVDACNGLIQECNFNYVVAKKGDKGMTIVGKNNFVKHIEAHPVENPDVTGAGDTVVATLSLAFAKTNDIEISATIANAAAAVVVGKTGTATVTIEEINNYISINE